MALQIDDLADLIAVTQRELGKDRWVDLTSDIQKFHAMPQLLKQNNIVQGSGTGFEWTIMIDDNGAAENVGLFHVDNPSVNEYMARPYVPWRRTTTNWSWEEEEFLTNRSPARIVDLVKSREAAGMISMAKLMETDFWNFPALTDTESPYGIFYYLVFDDGTSTTACGATAAGAFCALNPYGHSACAGIDATATTRWSNWSHQYVNVTADDLIRKVRKGADYTEFTPPIEIPSFASGQDRVYYTVHSVKSTMEEKLRLQNDNLGPDVARYDNATVIRGAPVRWVPQLEEATILDSQGVAMEDPFIQMDWSIFKIAYLAGKWMRRTKPKVAPSQHTVLNQYVDCTWQPICRDRRRLAVYAL